MVVLRVVEQPLVVAVLPGVRWKGRACLALLLPEFTDRDPFLGIFRPGVGGDHHLVQVKLEAFAVGVGREHWRYISIRLSLAQSRLHCSYEGCGKELPLHSAGQLSNLVLQSNTRSNRIKDIP